MTDEGIVAFGDGGGEGFLVEGTGLSKVSFFTIIAELGKGGKATPVFIGTSMIILAGLLLAAEFLSRNSILKTEKIEGSLPRRIIFVGLMIVWVSFLPYLGFLISSILAFALISSQDNFSNALNSAEKSSTISSLIQREDINLSLFCRI